MKKQILLPNRFKKLGWVILLPVALAGLCMILGIRLFPEINGPIFALASDKGLLEGVQYFKVIKTNIVPTLLGVLTIIGGLLVAFSKEKEEDEYIASIRLNSLLWAVLVSYLVLIISFLFVYDTAFLTALVINLFTALLVFIARFNYLLLQNKNSHSDDQ